MKALIQRSFCLVAISLLLMQGVDAQRGRDGRHRFHQGRPFIGQRVAHIGGPRIILPYRGISFHYSSGYYYRPYGGYFRVIAPPFGLFINVLPFGYYPFYLGGNPYYYYGGTYYRPGPTDNYEVVDAPLGASVPELPNGTKVVVINDQKYYEHDGTYYKEEIRDNDEIWYTVTGKNGNLDTDDANTDYGPRIGDMVDELPANCRTVVVNGNKYLVSPDDVYYQEVTSGNSLRYKIVGK